METRDLKLYLAATSVRHSHLCPRQVLGIRLALAGTNALGLVVPCFDKLLLTIVESDGCFSDGVCVVTGSSVGHRTLRVEDYGKAAITLVNTLTGISIRVSPKIGVRQRAHLYAPGEDRPYFAQLYGYQVMPDAELVNIQPVELYPDVNTLISQPGMRAVCEICGEEIINGRQVIQDGQVLCRACTGLAYYHDLEPTTR